MHQQDALPQGIRHVFLDRDGTIIQDKHYLCQPEEVEILPMAGECLARLTRAGGKLYVVTNQSGIGRGLFSTAAYTSVEQRLDAILKEYGAVITATRHCPHAPPSPDESGCKCRKPRTGMWKSLQAEYSLTPEACLMAGDKLGDLKFGIRAGFAASVLVLTGKGADEAEKIGATLAPGRVIQPLSKEVLAHLTPDLPKTFSTRLYIAQDLCFLNEIAMRLEAGLP